MLDRVLTAALLCAVLLGGAALPVFAQEGDDGPCGLPPEGKPQRIKGGESLPPLPLPATPLRRTERKREPAPPTLVGKVMWGETHVQFLQDGRKFKYADWNLDPADLQRLLKVANNKLGIRYRHAPVEPASWSFNPSEIPILYFTGKRAIHFTDEVRAKLRQYVEAGGYLWGDACSGSDAFAQAFRQEMAAIFANRPLAPLSPDHPVFSCYQPLKKVQYTQDTKDRPDGAPFLEGLYVGCRTAVFLSKYDLSCAWDSNHTKEGAKGVLGEDAISIGLNLVSYCLAYYDLGKYLSKERVVEAEETPGPSDFVFAQVRHSGNWDPDPSAFANLLKAVTSGTSTRVTFQKKPVRLSDPTLLSYPFLYMTGHEEFVLGDDEVAGLRRFVSNGGFLLVDSCCGNLGFDAALRRELKRAFPNAALSDLPKDHPIYGTQEHLVTVEYTPKVRATFGEMNAPYLEGITLDGATRVVYSRFDLGCGWENQEHPWAKGVLAKDALRLGINAVVYALTH
ncbi:MAG: DUF4159 domain-containing protein [Planctomycetes bacterium]|nr:DUF4159 domain-containing protein [Planctomycetota bacterium]